MNNAKNTTLFPYLERLLEGEEVQWKTLGEVCDYEQPTAYLVRNTNYSDQYPIPVLTAGKTFILGYTNETTGIYRASEHPTIIFDDFTTANKWVDFDFKAKSSAMKMLTSKDEKVCLLKYIYYWLNTLPADSIVGDHNRQWISNYAQKLFPLPPLRVQARIVEILDKFTQLEAELEAELEARKKQYAYYRDQLLNFSQCPPLNVNIEWKTLGAIGTFYRGTSFQKKDFTSEGVGCIHYGEIYTHYGVSAQDTISKLSAKKANNARKANYGDLIIATTSENDEDVCKSVAWLGNESIVVSNDACYYQHALDPKYVAYFFLTNDFQQQKRAFITGTKVRRVNPRDLAKIIIPIPPLSEQRRIVDILDRFETLTNSISEGLPKEIALRRKQYEYYRDALLSFPRPEATV